MPARAGQAVLGPLSYSALPGLQGCVGSSAQYCNTVMPARVKAVRPAAKLSSHLQLEGLVGVRLRRVEHCQGSTHLDGIPQGGACAVHLQRMDRARLQAAHSQR